MATPIEEVRRQLGALDSRLAREHQENRERLTETATLLRETDEKVAAKLDAIAEKLDAVREIGWRHDEQIKTIQRGGGGVLAFVATALGALLVEWVKRGTGGH